MHLLKKIFRFNPSRVRLEAFIQRAARSTKEGWMVFDAGAGEGYYKRLFKNGTYHATDLCKLEKAYGRIHFISDLKSIPVRNEAYDLILCTQVLEHLPQPDQVLGELFRVLKPSGQLWFSAPFFFPEHEVPYDFFRYTRYGLTHLLETQGFEVREINWLEGYLGSLGFQLRVAARSFELSPSAYGNRLVGIIALPFILLAKVFFYLLSLVFYFLELRFFYIGKGHGKNFCGVAVKPAR